MKLPELKIGTKIAKVPIMQGGMAIRLSTGALAAAVANQGGIGLIAASGMSPEQNHQHITSVLRYYTTNMAKGKSISGFPL